MVTVNPIIVSIDSFNHTLEGRNKISLNNEVINAINF